MERRGVLAGLVLLTLGPLPPVAWLGLRGIDALEERQADLARRQAVAALVEGLANDLAGLARGDDVSPLTRDSAPLPIFARGEHDSVNITSMPDGGALAHPAAERARLRRREGRLVEALEAIEGLLHGPDPELRAVGAVEAAEVLAAMGRMDRSLELARDAADAVGGAEPWNSWCAVHLARWGQGEDAAANALEEWLADLDRRPTTLEELVLVGHAIERLGPRRAGPLSAALADRRTRPRARRLAEAALADLSPGDGPALLAIGDELFLARRSAEPVAWRVAGLETWLAGWSGPAGETAALEPASDGSSSTAAVVPVRLRDASGADTLPVDLGDLTLAVTFRDPPLFGGWNPRALLAGGLATYALLAILALRALRSREHEARSLAAARGDLIAEVTHELRTPLTVLRMYAETLSHGRLAPEAQREYLDTLQREAVRLGDLVDHVAEAARGEAPLAPSNTILDPREVLERVAADLRPVVEAAGGSLALDPGGTAHVRGDEEELRRVLELLMDNAIRYSGECPRIELAAHVGGTHWTATLRDHGPGIPPEERERVFERWMRGKRGREGGRRGAGMGLFLARRGARGLGGELTLEFPGDGGTRARLELPRIEPEEGAP